MDRSTFAHDVAALTLGKRMPDGVYAHVESLPFLPDELRAAVDAARALAKLDADAFHVVKFALRGWKLSLLAYPGFFDEAFPTLAASWVVDLDARAVTSRAYAAEGNPPILHRKELLLPPDHPRARAYAELTAAAERLGLFAEASAIGMRRPWEARLARLGVRLEGHRLIDTRPNATVVDGATAVEAPEEPPAIPVQRHRTALQRYSLSTPMQALFRHGYLDGRGSVFDYGCGRGDDVRILAALGVDAAGWDPHFAAGNEKREADVVNLGFVVNVIEDVRERRDALAGAYGLARKVLAVAALIGGRTAFEQHRLFRDGVLTTRGTFQKYFSQQELREYLEETLGREPIAVAPGVFFVFREDAEEQRFLAARQTQARCPVRLPKVEVEREEQAGRPKRLPRAPKAPRVSRWEQHRELLEDFWGRCLELGRLPKEAEYGRLPELRGSLGTPQTVLKRLREERGEGSIEAARRARMDDLLVYLALNVFERRRSFRRLPESLQRDVAAFWGSHAAAQGEATRLLFSLGRTEVIHEACSTAAAGGLGYLDGDHALQLHSSLVPRLPAVLRAYVGCASRLYGEVEAADLVKIHVQSGKLSLMTYDDFAGKPLPKLLERVKIDLRAQRVQFFDYGDAEAAQVLYDKSRYVTPDFERYAEQVRFDEALGGLGIDLSGFGPDARVLAEALDGRGMRIDGFRLVAGGGVQIRS
jgi:DNA phosphorothioation-associated putative methyltransferase